MEKSVVRILSVEPTDLPFSQLAQISAELLARMFKNFVARTQLRWRRYCSGRQTARVAAMLEIPVVHATFCQVWQIHKWLQVRETAPSYGRLLAELL
jgi:hypothetical protein